MCHPPWAVGGPPAAGPAPPTAGLSPVSRASHPVTRPPGPGDAVAGGTTGPSNRGRRPRRPRSSSPACCRRWGWRWSRSTPSRRRTASSCPPPCAGGPTGRRRARSPLDDRPGAPMRVAFHKPSRASGSPPPPATTVGGRSRPRGSPPWRPRRRRWQAGRLTFGRAGEPDPRPEAISEGVRGRKARQSAARSTRNPRNCRGKRHLARRCDSLSGWGGILGAGRLQAIAAQGFVRQASS